MTVQFRATDGAGNVSAVGSVRIAAVPPVEETAVTLAAPVLSKTQQAYGSVKGLRATVSTTVSGATSGRVTFTSGATTLGSAPVRKVGGEHRATLRIASKQPRGTYRSIKATFRTSDGKTVLSPASKAKLKVVKATTVKARPAVTGKSFRAGTRPTVKVRVPKLTNGRYATGFVRVKVGAKNVAKVKLLAKHKGKLTVRLPRGYSSSIKVSVRYLPKEKKVVKASSWSKKVTVRVRR